MARTKQTRRKPSPAERAEAAAEAAEAERARPKPLSGDCQDGYGKKDMGYGEIYEGHFKDGQPHGEGSWTHSEATGRFKDMGYGAITTGTFERGSMVIGTVTISTDNKKYDDEVLSLEEEIAALKEELAVAVERAATNRASDGASWTGTWASDEYAEPHTHIRKFDTPSGEGVWRLRDGREARGACPRDIVDDRRRSEYAQSWTAREIVPLWVHEAATTVAVPVPEAPEGVGGAAGGCEPQVSAVVAVAACAAPPAVPPAVPPASVVSAAAGGDGGSSSSDDEDED